MTGVALSDLAAKTGPKGPEVMEQRGGRGRLHRTAVLAAAVVILFFASVLLGSYTVTISDFFTIEIGRASCRERV